MIDRTPKGKTIRKYFPRSILTDDELHELARSYAIMAGIMFVKPASNQGFNVLVRVAEDTKRWKLKLIENISQYNENQDWDDYLKEIIKWIEKL
jgi:hypothetical protein